MILQVKWDEQIYEYDPEMIDVFQARKIKEFTGYGMRSWQKAIDDGEPDALVALLWVIKHQAGERPVMAKMNFSISGFYEAITAASLEYITKELERAEAEGEDPEDFSEPERSGHLDRTQSETETSGNTEIDTSTGSSDSDD